MFLNPLVLLFFSKYWGANTLCPPEPNYWRGHGPPAPPIAPPWTATMFYTVCYQKTVPYSLKSRSHNLTLTCKSAFYDDRNFINRVIFSKVY